MDKLNIDFTKQEINFSEKGERKTVSFAELDIKKRKDIVNIDEALIKITFYFKARR